MRETQTSVSARVKAHKKIQQSRVFFPDVTKGLLAHQVLHNQDTTSSLRCSYHVSYTESLENLKLTLTGILHLTETRVFLKLVIACVLL